jgi:thioredoxin-related protein
MRRHVLRLLALILAWPPLALGVGTADIPVAHDLSGDGRDMKARAAVMLTLYSQANCRWCERAKAEYLIPLQNDPAWAGRVLLRQIALDSEAPLVDFAGRRTTQQAFARAERVRVTPTLVVYGPDGARLAEPIVGFRLADFYSSYIERALTEALARTGRTAR